MIYLTKEQFLDIVNHAKQEYPKEACGILAGSRAFTPVNEPKGSTPKEVVTKVYKMTNVSNNPETCYFMNPEEQLKVFKEIRQSGIEMIGIYHSHSHSSAYPSARDIEMAFYPEADYIIISLKDDTIVKGSPRRVTLNTFTLFSVNSVKGLKIPEVRVFKIIEGKITEEKLIVDSL